MGRTSAASVTRQGLNLWSCRPETTPFISPLHQQRHCSLPCMSRKLMSLMQSSILGNAPTIVAQ